MTRLFLSTLFITQIFYSQAQNAIPNNFIAPLDIPAKVSGTFGELRNNHFHSGVDFTTQGKCGFKVKAIADGYVSRIRISSIGYGKAVYVTHSNGYTSVYGHLDGFPRRIDSVVISKHYQLEKFDIDQYFSPSEMPVVKGEVVGLSGNSGGSSGPHLHFEIRDTKTEEILNPFLFRRDVLDNVKPNIHGIGLYPLNAKATVAGQHKSVYAKAVKINGIYQIENGTVYSATGSLGLGIHTFDNLTGSSSQCGIYSVAVWVDDFVIYKSEMNRFAFSESRDINSYIDYASKISLNRSIQKCYVDPNNTLRVYKELKNDGIITIVPNKTHSCKIEVADFHGNISTINFKIKGTAVANQSVVEPIHLAYDKSHELTNDGVEVLLPTNSLYKNEPFDLKKAGVGTVSSVWRVGNNTIPLRLPIAVSIKVPEKFSHLNKTICIAKQESSGKLTYVGGSNSSGWVSVNTTSTGNYTLAIDSIKPQVSIKNPIEKNIYKGRSTLELTVTDNFSGIAGFRCLIDDKWALFEHDAKTNRLICPLNRIPIIKNKNHTLEVMVVDGCGNTSTKKWVFYY